MMSMVCTITNKQKNPYVFLITTLSRKCVSGWKRRNDVELLGGLSSQ